MGYALLVIDMLNDFIRGKLALRGAETIIGNIAALIKGARDSGTPVIYLCDSHLKGIDHELKLWGDHALKGEIGSKIIDELSPTRRDYVVEKRRYDGFMGTDLDLLLRELKADEVILTGLATDICVLHTAAGAFFRGYGIVVVKDATLATKPERQEIFLNYMREIYGAKLMVTEEVLSKLFIRK
ncbi:MAG: nicotinamidase [Thermofilum sp. ex4484_15]|nr:MAG: nicotinamidase [Thermofilum sp. ex4484_15]